MRKQKSSCTALIIFLRSDPHKKGVIPYRNSCVVTLPYATNSSITLSKYAVLGLHKIFKKGILYKKAGVMTMGLVPTASRQLPLFGGEESKHLLIMKALDHINKRFGPHQMKLANQDLQYTWKMKQEHLSQRYTTEISEIIEVK